MDVSSQLMMPKSNTIGKDEIRYSFNDIYFQIINQTVNLMNQDATKLQAVSNERTGEICHTFTQGLSFCIDVEKNLPFSMLRKFYPGTAAAEAAWFIKGEQDVTWIKKYCPIWDDFVEDDGKTVQAAYGHRWRKHFGRDQLKELVHALFTNPSDRRTVLCAWDPAEDGLMNRGTKNVPCPFAMSYYIVGGKLMMSYYIRSSDLYVGLPYDIYCTAFVMDAIVHELRNLARAALIEPKLLSADEANKPGVDRLVMLSNLTTGTMTTTLGNPHMYDKHVDLAKEALEYYTKNSAHYFGKAPTGQEYNPPLPNWSITEIERNPDAYVQAVKRSFANCVKSHISQKPEVAI